MAKGKGRGQDTAGMLGKVTTCVAGFTMLMGFIVILLGVTSVTYRPRE